MKTFVVNTLARFARRVLAREKPEIVAVTGSVGKTSTKQAIGAVLAAKFAVRVSPKNYNTELGVPLTILGVPSAGTSPFGWIGALFAGWREAAFGAKDYPGTLVLEMAADHPGDIAYLVNLAPPSIGVVTAVGESHYEFFGSTDAIQKEKRQVIERLPRSGLAVLNRDDERVWAMREKTKANVVSFGFHGEAAVRALDESVTYACAADAECGTHFKVAADGSVVPFFLPNVLGRQAISAALAAIAVGLRKGMHLIEISDALRTYEGPPGRMRAIPGIKGTVIIDDTYNAAPRSAAAALAALRELPAAENATRFAVLGDMLELGSASAEGHRLVGKKAAETADVLVFLGERMAEAANAARVAGVSEDRVFHFGSNEEAAHFIKERIRHGDIALVKGSRGMRMERIVEELMAEPLDAKKLLVSASE